MGLKRITAQRNGGALNKALLSARPGAKVVGIESERAKKQTKANAAMHPQVIPEEIFSSEALKRKAYYADEHVLILNMDVRAALRVLAEHGMMVNCVVTSPPFYGQRDYEVDGQIGLEEHPREFIRSLVDTFNLCRPILADNGSMWVNLGDTYWSGKGEHKSGEVKQSARRFGFP